jgi:tRNA(Ile)-lysidine synthase
VDAETVAFPIRIRFRRPGDTFQPLGMPGKKRVKKFFIDRKIPRNKRESIPIFEDVTGIFWIVGQSIDERVKITPQTTRVLRCCVEVVGENPYQ